ncbi:hypothetical protein LCGC14_0137010 [marine sediment metagenome]|uniref:Uncharacterized protein n=1 Tax=marine sediment metagenome TaxID=412755 RepID=A0A0F9VHE8_9ZZZZ
MVIVLAPHRKHGPDRSYTKERTLSGLLSAGGRRAMSLENLSYIACRLTTIFRCSTGLREFILVSTLSSNPPVFQTGSIQREYHAIIHWQALRLPLSLPHRLVDEILIQSADWTAAPAGARHLPSGVSRERGPNLARGTVERSCPHVRLGAAEARRLGSGAQDEGPFVSQSATGVSSHPKALMGVPVLGQGVFFNCQRRHHGRHCISVS